MKIIHLSDFHLNNEKLPVNHRRILDALIKDLANYQIDNDTLLIFSGDFLNLGGKNFETPATCFQTFVNLIFEPIYDKYPSLRNRTFFVPGNHDLSRDKIKASHKATKKQILDSSELREELYEELKEDLVGFIAYNQFKDEFYSTCTFMSKELTFFENNFQLIVDEELIGITSFNSSTFCYENNDLGNLLLFEKQLTNSLEQINECDVKIAILHHPINFFHKSESDKVKEFLEKEYDLVFFGHTHKQESAFNQSLNGNCYFAIGKSLNGEVTEDTIYNNGYSIVDYIPNTSLKVHLRKFNNTSDAFIANSDYGKEDGIQEISINS